MVAFLAMPAQFVDSRFGGRGLGFFAEGGVHGDERPRVAGGRGRRAVVRVEESGDPSLLARRVEVFRVELRLRVRRVAGAAREGPHVPADAEESHVPKRSAELLAVLKNVLGGRQRMRLARQVRP